MFSSQALHALPNWPVEGTTSYVEGKQQRANSRLRILAELDGGYLASYIVTKNDYAWIDECFLLHPEHVQVHPNDPSALLWTPLGGYEEIETENLVSCTPCDGGVEIRTTTHVGLFCDGQWVYRDHVGNVNGTDGPSGSGIVSMTVL
jgi:hypothetical protein